MPLSMVILKEVVTASGHMMILQSLSLCNAENDIPKRFLKMGKYSNNDALKIAIFNSKGDNLRI